MKLPPPYLLLGNKEEYSAPCRKAGFRRAFTLLEVMVAIGIFFVCSFAILQLISGTLKNARALQRNEPDPGMLAAELAQTNILVEGVESGDFDKLYPGYSWTREVSLITNGLFQVDFTVTHRVETKNVAEQLSVLMYKPNSPAVAGGGKGFLQ